MQYYGIELEMVVYYKDYNKMNYMQDIFRKHKFYIKGDGSVHPTQNVKKLWNNTYACLEIVSSKVTLEKFKKTITNVFNELLNNKSFRLKINEGTPNDCDIRIDFNKTTGTHIHYSNSKCSIKERYATNPNYYSRTITYATRIITPEINYFKENTKLLEKIRDTVYDSCKYDTIKKHMYRSYAKKEIVSTDRCSSINVSNAHRHGTIEFRMCNLLGVPTSEVVNAIFNQLESINKGIKLAWIEQIRVERLKLRRLLDLQKSIRVI